MTDAFYWLSQFLNGLTIGMILLLIASGLTMLLGVLTILNFAHGAFYMLGAYLLYSIFVSNFLGWFWIALIIIPLFVAITSGFLETFLLRPLYKRERLYTLLLTFGLAMVFDDLVLIFWGRDFLSVEVPKILSGTINLGEIGYPVYFLFIIFLGPIVSLILWYMLYKTKFGKLIRAASNDVEMLEALGINVKWVFTGVFALGASLSCLGGLLVAPYRSIVPGMGLEIFIESFIVVVIGGLGSFRGAIIGALIIGQLEAFGILIIPNFSMIFMYLILLLVLIFKPTGLYGEKTI